ncbi:nitroreductase family protein [Vandammella animalimorsus]|uniref:Nitroreductase family protein n=1 Tax=Vandammella animalimorsus TaxID=2029117 RepID=A0A2A2T7A5_9BURK|nr:nitroreductase family protein [Vandammella animalimorsus]PAX17810.1 nitroreductase family protein [Vandammella animalimorsus]PAX19964.1 nitroreductase family protein [Vandammella animalimorsus]
MNLMELLRRRSSAHAFAESAISDAELRHLAQAASLAPLAFHLHNWRFTTVCSPEAKQALCEAAFRQPKILQAAAVFIISGDLLGYQALAERLQPVVAAGQMDQATADGWAAFAQSAFHEQPQAQRDEAMRSASLAAMALMLAAAEAGWASCPMSGFDPAAVRKLASLPESHLPVLLVAVGKAAVAQAQKVRAPVEQLWRRI